MNLESNKVREIVISGGEPLIYKDSHSFISDISKRKMRINILTNACLITDELIPLLISDNILLNISFESCNADIHNFIRGTNCHEMTKERINKLSESGVQFQLSTVLCRLNSDEIKQLYDFSVSVSARSLNIGMLDPIGKGKNCRGLMLNNEELSSIRKQCQRLKELGKKTNIEMLMFDEPKENHPIDRMLYCSAGTKWVSISPGGELYPCTYAFGLEGMKIGDLKKNSLKDLWASPKWSFFRGGYSIQDLPECEICSLNKVCKIKNCRLRGYEASGSFFAPPPNCPKTYM